VRQSDAAEIGAEPGAVSGDENLVGRVSAQPNIFGALNRGFGNNHSAFVDRILGGRCDGRCPTIVQHLWRTQLHVSWTSSPDFFWQWLRLRKKPGSLAWGRNPTLQGRLNSEKISEPIVAQDASRCNRKIEREK